MIPSRFARRIPGDDLRGLHPRAWLCVGPGFVREEIKAALFSREGGGPRGITNEAVTTVQDICLRLLGADADDVLTGVARQEVLRSLLADRRISSRTPELKRLKRQGQFFRRLDQAIQAGRLAFAHADEEGVYCERLEARLGPNAVREEVRLISFAYEAWLKAESLWDLPLLLQFATEKLSQGEWPSSIRKPERIFHFTAQFPESRELAFWEALGREVTVERVGPVATDGMPEPRTQPIAWRWKLWHTMDDAAEGLGDDLSALIKRGSIEEPAVLLWDAGSVRRSMNRVLTERGLPLSDPRDPTRMRWDEALKWGMLPLEIVARDFERARVISWLRVAVFHEDHVAWVREIHERGIRQGLHSYAGGRLTPAHLLLAKLHAELGGRKTCRELGEAHLRTLSACFSAEGFSRPQSAFDLPKFFEGIWSQLWRDYERLGLKERRAPALYWLERLSARLAEAPPPVARLKPEHGLRTYRLQQAPLQVSRSLFIFGMPSSWLDGDSVGDYWFSEREREVLAVEFAVRGVAQVREERARALLSWLEEASEVTVSDVEFDESGRERESIYPVLAELARLTATDVPTEPERPGAHPRWAPSFGAIRPVPPQRVELPPLQGALTEGGVERTRPIITATALDHASRCGLRALVAARWKLWDMEEPDSELWPHVRGNILHHAVKTLMLANKEGRDPSLEASGPAVDQALQLAWAAERPRGLLQGERIADYARMRLRRVLQAFLVKEREYSQKSGARPIELDARDFMLECGEFAIRGTPDRIDETADGIFVMDYKSGSGQPNGSDMLEKGYRLQLPFYALAASKELGKPALGVQFVELTPDAKRSSGVFFERYNGKEPGKLTQLTRRSKSLLAADPIETWASFELRIREIGQAFVNGIFEAKPKKTADCNGCGAVDVCGKNRLTPELSVLADESVE